MDEFLKKLLEQAQVQKPTDPRSESRFVGSMETDPYLYPEEKGPLLGAVRPQFPVDHMEATLNHPKSLIPAPIRNLEDAVVENNQMDTPTLKALFEQLKGEDTPEAYTKRFERLIKK